jgi:hypothetical protein
MAIASAHVNSATRTPVLRDAADDGFLAAHGYCSVATPLISTHVAAHLRAEFGRLHGWAGSGWYNAFNVPDLDTRRRCSDVLRRHLETDLARTFVGFEPFLYTYLVKWPGTDQNENFLFLHRDWMYVDESDGTRSFVVFLALEDIGPANGQILVLPGGVDIDDALRGSSLIAPWLEHDDVIRPHLVPVPLRTGQCAIWDGAIVHCSEQNRTEAPRVAVGVWMRPVGRPLVHYRRVDQELAERHDISPELFATFTPDTIDAHLATRRPAATLPSGEVDFSPEELAAILDRPTRVQ